MRTSVVSSAQSGTTCDKLSDRFPNTQGDRFLTRGAHCSVYLRAISPRSNQQDSPSHCIVKRYSSLRRESFFYKFEGKLLSGLSPNFAIAQNEEIEFNYLSTDTLSSILATASFSQLMIFNLAISILTHLDVLHNSRSGLCVLHRNLEPKHIIVQINNNTISTQLIDYTYAISLPTNTYFPSELNPIYRAPEMSDRCKEGSNTDIWSFGAVLYEIFTKGIPLLDAASVAMFRKDRTSLIKKRIAGLDLIKMFPKTWNFWESILKDCLNMEPDYRISSKNLLDTLTKFRSSSSEKLTYLILETEFLHAQKFFRGNFLFYKQGYLIEQLIFFLEAYETDKITSSDPMYVYILLYYVYSSIKNCVFQLRLRHPNIFAKSSAAFRHLSYNKFQDKVYSYLRKLGNQNIKKEYSELNLLMYHVQTEVTAIFQEGQLPYPFWNICRPTDGNCLDFMQREWSNIKKNIHLRTFAARISQVMHGYEHYHELINQDNIKMPMQAQWVLKAFNLQKKLKVHFYMADIMNK